MKKFLLIFVIGGGLLVLVALGLRDIRRMQSQSSGSAPGNAAKGIAKIRFVKNPAPAPPFSVQDLDGNTLSPSDWRGQVVLLNFWATWCAPCRAEIPDLIRLQEKYKGRLRIIGLSDDTGSAEKVKQFAREMRINYPIAIASPELESKFGGVLGLPTSFLLDTKGRVVQKHVGLRDPALYDLEIRALLGLPVEAEVETFEDTGQVFLANVNKATELPGVDLSKLTPEQRKAALRRLNEESCNCGCGLTLAQCRINDSECEISQKLAKEVVEKIAKGT